MRLFAGVLGIVSSLIAIAAPAPAQEATFDIGAAIAVDAADGEPANDIPGAGVFARYRLSDQWSLGAAVNRTEYDYETPAEILDIRQDPDIEVIDALAEATTVRAWLERSLNDATRPTQFFVGAGVGAAFTDVLDVTGPREDGERFDIHSEVDTEILVSILGGVRRRFGKRWYGEAVVRVEQHFADWRSTDRVSGLRGSIDDYLTWGVQLGLAFRW